MPSPLSRRSVLFSGGAVLAVGAGALAGVETGLLPGGSRLDRALGRNGTAGVVPDLTPGTGAQGRFHSPARGTEVGWRWGSPPGHSGDGLPVVVVLHGRGGDHSSTFNSGYLGLDRFLAAVVSAGTAPFAIASIDGGASYWHDRRDDRAATMVVEEFLPLLSDQGLDTSRIGLLGWSMGGFGALHLTHLLGAGRVAGVGTMSAALWNSWPDTAPGAFDDRADFERTTVMQQQGDLAAVPLRVDCGESDPFIGANRTYVAGFDARPAGTFARGAHDVGYWRRMAPAQLRHLGAALTR